MITTDGDPLVDSRGRQQTSLVVMPRTGAEGERPSQEHDEVKAVVLEALPEWPDKAGVPSRVVPKASAILGRNVDHKTVTTACFALEREGLAESGPGRQKGSLAWGKAKPKEEPPDAGEEM